MLIKTVTGQEITTLDRFLAAKNSVVLMIDYFSGTRNTLWWDSRTSLLSSSLIPIFVKVIISKYIKECKKSKDRELNYLSQKFLTYFFYQYKDIVSDFISHINLPPIIDRKMMSKQEFHEKEIGKTYRQLLLYLDQEPGGKPGGKTQMTFDPDPDSKRFSRERKTYKAALEAMPHFISQK